MKIKHCQFDMSILIPGQNGELRSYVSTTIQGKPWAELDFDPATQLLYVKVPSEGPVYIPASRIAKLTPEDEAPATIAPNRFKKIA